jgi:hypothetical protein
MASPWPPKYLVSECTTKSAPSSSGRVATGVAKVESTTTSRTPAWRASPASAAMSPRRMIGLAGVSSHSILVCGRMAAATWPASEVSTGVTSDAPARQGIAHQLGGAHIVGIGDDEMIAGAQPPGEQRVARGHP